MNMTPYLEIDNQRNVLLGDGKSSSYLPKAPALQVEAADSLNLRFAQLGGSVAFTLGNQSQNLGMVSVLNFTYPLQVVRPIVKPITVLVIADRTFRSWPYECKED